MTQNSTPWDGISVGDAANAPYSANDWSHLWALMHGMGSQFPNYGVLLGTGDGTYNPLQVIATGSANIDVKVGAALVNGKLYETDAAVPLVVGANGSGNPRIDTVVLRIDYTAQTVRPVIKQGTPAGSPTSPALTQNTTLWEMPLANIAVANGFSSLTQNNISDRRRMAGSTGYGWQPFAYNVGYLPNGTYSNPVATTRLLAVPFVATGNMNVEQIVVRTAQTDSSRVVFWAIYMQDLNEGSPNENIVRRLGGRVNHSVGVPMVADTNTALPAIPVPVMLTPGSYWLVLDLNGVMSVRSIAGSSFDSTTVKALRSNLALFSLDQTIDLSLLDPRTEIFPFRLEGTVLGGSLFIS